MIQFYVHCEVVLQSLTHLVWRNGAVDEFQHWVLVVWTCKGTGCQCAEYVVTFVVINNFVADVCGVLNVVVDDRGDREAGQLWRISTDTMEAQGACRFRVCVKVAVFLGKRQQVGYGFVVWFVCFLYCVDQAHERVFW